MLYTQIFQELYYQADFNCGGRLPIHVTFMLDEFANVALPDDYILDEIAKFVAVPHNSCRSFSGTAAVRPSLNICRRADDICFRIFSKINNYANRSNICAMFKKFIIKFIPYHIKLFFKLSFLEIFLYSLGVIPVLFLNIFIKHISFPYPQRSDISLTVISVVER